MRRPRARKGVEVARHGHGEEAHVDNAGLDYSRLIHVSISSLEYGDICSCQGSKDSCARGEDESRDGELR